MRLCLSLNGVSRFVASRPSAGYLNAHLNMVERPKENDHSKKLRVVGIETRETETLRLEWPIVDLNVGDVVELRILPEGDGDTPCEIQKSSESPDNLFSNTALAKEFIEVASEFEGRVSELVRKWKGIEQADEHKKVALAVGAVLAEIGQRLWYPVFRRHKELVPDSMKGELL